MDSIRKFAAPEGGRVETGPVQFGDDWPGLFIRGDNAFGYAMSLLHLLKEPTDFLARLQAEALIKELISCNTNPEVVQDLIKALGG
jgi:hypothetical protein